jgi:hypothetical protein
MKLFIQIDQMEWMQSPSPPALGVLCELWATLCPLLNYITIKYLLV